KFGRAPPAQAEESRVHAYVFRACQIGVKTGSELEQSRDPSRNLDGSFIRPGEPRYQAEQRALARPIRAHYGYTFPRLHDKRDVFERMESFAVLSLEPVTQAIA